MMGFNQKILEKDELNETSEKPSKIGDNPFYHLLLTNFQEFIKNSSFSLKKTKIYRRGVTFIVRHLWHCKFVKNMSLNPLEEYPSKYPCYRN